MDQHEAKNNKKSNTDEESTQETFSEMASVTTKSGVAGKLLVISLIVVSLAVTAFVGFAIFRGVNGENYIKGDSYQAVTLSDGMIYYGKISDLDSSYMTLTDVYYLQPTQVVEGEQDAEVAGDTKPIQLVKLGEEKHCPSDNLYINRDQVIHWENIRPEGEVVKAIEAFLNSHGGNDEVVCSTIQ